MNKKRQWPVVLLAVALLSLLPARPAEAQQGTSWKGYQPLDQRTPPGLAARWMRLSQPPGPEPFQPVRLTLPDGATVTIDRQSAQSSGSLTTPALIGLKVGFVYRFQISNLPEWPGVTLYPTIELLDRLHPPPGRAKDYPVPVVLTRREIRRALQGQLVTKVVYLEQPQLARPEVQKQPLPVTTLAPRRNLLTQADRRGRPLLIVRLGGRRGDVRGRRNGFAAPKAPVSLFGQATAQSTSAPRRNGNSR